MAEKSKKGRGKLVDQITRLEGLVGPEGIAKAKELALSDPDVVSLAFKYVPKPYRQQGLKKGEKAAYWQFRAIKGGEANAEKWRNDRLIARGLDPKVVGPEPAQEEKKEKATAK